eukprot:6881409-Alexandrium_andersonii.AAC.1
MVKSSLLASLRGLDVACLSLVAVRQHHKRVRERLSLSTLWARCLLQLRLRVRVELRSGI